ncbi:hypothetical protein GWK47_009917 [Chionoecetes opilio]|uniref:Uncharacterized protein n=1 Tax=Chionoecetes opilio TaxID=41210 RepID=A0A8J5CPE2_CHIOP|nr:hypothetical protein GWK47_009917 [Chionoecetes opilio]
MCVSLTYLLTVITCTASRCSASYLSVSPSQWVEEDEGGQALMSPGPTATEGTNSTRLSNKMGKELESWCSEKQRNKLLEQAMFPALSRAAWGVDVFVKYNTAIDSYAAVERLFSQGSDIMKAKRASLTSDNFERLVGLHEGEHGPAQDGTITRRL